MAPPSTAKKTVDAALDVTPPASRRVLITGVGRFWGARLARQLEDDPSIELVAAVDSRDPDGDFGRTEIVRGDIRNPSVARLLQVTRVDTVVHTQIFGADRPNESSRLQHDMNVIGTMNLLAACAKSPFVRKVIIRSSTAIYGASPRDPAFFEERHTARAKLSSGYSRDIAEVESYARDYSERAPHVAVTVLRFANSIGQEADTPLMRYLTGQIVPTYAGFNPRLQFVTDRDAVHALAHAVRHWRPGTFNIAGPGTITLWRFLRLAGRIGLPLLPPVMSPALGLLSRAGVFYVPKEYRALLQYGRGVSTKRMSDVFGFTPEYTTREAAESYAAYVRVRRYHEQEDRHPFERELLEYVQRKMQTMPPVSPDAFAKLTGRLDD